MERSRYWIVWHERRFNGKWIASLLVIPKFEGFFRQGKVLELKVAIRIQKCNRKEKIALGNLCER